MATILVLLDLKSSTPGQETVNRKLKSGHQTCSTKIQIPYSQKMKVNDIPPKQY